MAFNEMPGVSLIVFDWSPDGELSKRYKLWEETVALFCWKRTTFCKDKEGDKLDDQKQLACRTIMALAGEVGLQYIETAKTANHRLSRMVRGTTRSISPPLKRKLKLEKQE